MEGIIQPRIGDTVDYSTFSSSVEVALLGTNEAFVKINGTVDHSVKQVENIIQEEAQQI